MQTQRKYKDIMSEDRKSRLLGLGFNFEIAKKRNVEEWDAMLEELLKFKVKYSHVKVSSRYEDKKLANWVASQRKSYKAGKLLPERYQKLLDVGFIFPKNN